jgi:protein SSD1
VTNAVPSATTTDLAQATSQLAQLTQFRASAGHAKVPSFGTSSNFYGQSSYGGNNSNQTTPQQQRKSLFAPYLPAASIPPLVAAGKLVIGTLRVNKRNRSDAYVTSDALESDIYIWCVRFKWRPPRY